MASAIESQGFRFDIGNTASPIAYTEVKEITSFSLFDGQATEIDVTHTQSTAKEFLMGLQDFGNCSFECNYLQADPGQDAMRAAKVARTVTNFKATFSDNSYVTFTGFVLNNPISGGVDGKVDGSFTIRVTGSPVFSS